jgi:hypothetical protein
MSSSTLYRVYRTKTVAWARYRGSAGTGTVLWQYMAERYLRRELGWLDEMQEVWDLSLDPRVPRPWRMALEFTFDRWVCPPSLLASLAEACTEVGDTITQWKPTWLNHWSAMGGALQNVAARTDSRWLGVGLGCTSICDPWEEWHPRRELIVLMEA